MNTVQKMRNLKVAATVLFFFVFVIISCHSSNPDEQHQEQLAVFSVLQPNQYPQTVIVDKTYSLADTITDTTGVSGATVMIWNENLTDTIRFIESDTHGFYHDNIDPVRNLGRNNKRNYGNGQKSKMAVISNGVDTHWIKPLETYFLMVAFNGDTVIASTTVPDTFRFLSPQNGETLHTSSLPVLSWTKSTGGIAYVVCLFSADTTKPIIPLVVYDTFVDVNPFKFAYFDSTGFYRIKNFALDENRYRYEVGSPRLDTLGDGVGHFGSQTFDTLMVYIIKD
jgi:hypothetical protein